MKKLIYIFLSIIVLCVIAFAVFWYSMPYDLDFAEYRSAVPHAQYSRFIEVDGLRFHYQEKGSGTPLLLIHGNNSSTYTWKDVFEPLAEKYRVISIDLKGFGFSAKPDGDYRMPAQAEHIIHFLDKLNIERAIFCGNSMGGAVSLMCAINYPERVSGLILVDSAAFNDKRTTLLSPGFLKWPVIGPAVTALALTSNALIAEGLRNSFYDANKIGSDRITAYHRPLQTRRGQIAARLVRQQRDNTPIETSISRIRKPTLIIWGADDRVILPDTANRIQANIPGSKLTIFDKCGHIPQEEMPERFLEEVEKFLIEKRDSLQ